MGSRPATDPVWAGTAVTYILSSELDCVRSARLKRGVDLQPCAFCFHLMQRLSLGRWDLGGRMAQNPPPFIPTPEVEWIVHSTPPPSRTTLESCGGFEGRAWGGAQMFSSDLPWIWIVSHLSISWWLRRGCSLDLRGRELCLHLANGDNELGEDKERVSVSKAR